MAETPAATVRKDARDAMRRAILDAALGQLATTGADALSVRSVAREVGLASSAIYRHIPSRDALLTELIVEGYDALGAAAEAAEATVDREEVRARFAATGRAVRTWARANPYHYALLYGSPVPGYVAPETTIAPAARVAMVLAQILVDAAAAGLDGGAGEPPDPGTLGVDLLDLFGVTIDDGAAFRGLLAWISLFGVVSFELFGHLVGSVAEPDRFFDATLVALMDEIGLPR